MDASAKLNLRAASDAATAARDSLPLPARLDYERRRDLAYAVMRLARMEFHALDQKEKEYQGRLASNAHFYWFAGASAAGLLWHYIFRDEANALNFTFGSWLIVVSFILFVLYNYDTYRLTINIARLKVARNKLLFQWLSAGVPEHLFDAYRKVVDDDMGDDGAPTEDSWRFEVQLELALLRKVTGEDAVDPYSF